MQEKTHGVEADVVYSGIKQMEQNDASTGRATDDTDANVFEHHENDILEEAKQYVESGAVDRGVDDIVADKSKEAKQYDESGAVDSGMDDIATDKSKEAKQYGEPVDVDSGVADIAADKGKMSDVEREATVACARGVGGVPFSSECEFGTRVGVEDVGAASIHEGKSSED